MRQGLAAYLATGAELGRPRQLAMLAEAYGSVGQTAENLAVLVHRVTGLTGDRTALVTTLPCRAPHHTISDVGLIGGGHIPTPGEVSLAHTGVLSWMRSPSSDVMSLRSYANRSRRVSETGNLAGVLELARLAILSAP